MYVWHVFGHSVSHTAEPLNHICSEWNALYAFLLSTRSLRVRFISDSDTPIPHPILQITYNTCALCKRNDKIKEWYFQQNPMQHADHLCVFLCVLKCSWCSSAKSDLQTGWPRIRRDNAPLWCRGGHPCKVQVEGAYGVWSSRLRAAAWQTGGPGLRLHLHCEEWNQRETGYLHSKRLPVRSDILIGFE